MRNFLAPALLAAGLTLTAGLASAATLGLTTEAPSLSSSTAEIDYLEFLSDGNLSTFGAEVDATNGTSPVGLTEISFAVGFDVSDPTGDFGGGFDVFDDNGEFLAGDILAVGFSEDVIEFQFGNLSGSAADDFGSSVLALITFDDPLGVDPFRALADGDALFASISISRVAAIAPVPLPAGLPLLLTGALGFGLLKRRAKPIAG